MLRFPNQFARKRMLRFYLGPTLAGLIVGAGAFYYFGQAEAPAMAAALPPAAAPAMTAPFRNCAEARAAGAGPVLRGQPGYGAHLDRDGDGIGCEPYRGR